MQAAHPDDDVYDGNMNARGASGHSDPKILGMASPYYRQRAMFFLLSARIHGASPYHPGEGKSLARPQERALPL
ncbi:hypothetical protein EGT07_14715 [Herbaspirillum sp. HC18]|nr:hypothetical protein EGT07_14715 [Herbaspirillum sp. HC18]